MNKKIFKSKTTIFLIAILGIIITLGLIFTANYLMDSSMTKNSQNDSDSNKNSRIDIRDSFKPSPSTLKNVQTTKIYLISLGDEGKSGEEIGCGDSIVAVDKKISKDRKQLEGSIEKLLSLNQREDPDSGLYDALYQSNLKLEVVSVVDGNAEINLTGELKVAGVCDNPRIEEQIRRTAIQFPEVKSVEVFVNGEKLEDVLSGR